MLMMFYYYEHKEGTRVEAQPDPCVLRLKSVDNETRAKSTLSRYRF